MRVTDDQLHQMMIAFARVEEQIKAMREDITELKDWRDKVLMIVVSTVIVAGIGLLFGTGAVSLP